MHTQRSFGKDRNRICSGAINTTSRLGPMESLILLKWHQFLEQKLTIRSNSLENVIPILAECLNINGMKQIKEYDATKCKYNVCPFWS
jgi:hypothetical protein